MRPFSYARAASESDAIGAAGDRGTKFLAGGTTLLDLMKLGVETPAHLIDINRLPLSAVEEVDGGLRVGAVARNTEVAEHPLVKARYRALSEALLAGASPQLRNMASVGGNLLQRTRCTYFRDVDSGAACNKRDPGSGCAAIGGFNRMHAVLGTSNACIASHPSDMCVALAALDATVIVRGGAGGAERKIAFGDFHLAPGEHPEQEHALAPGELVTAVTLPAAPYFARSRYVKVRDRASYAFALTSAAVALDVEDGMIKQARVALGGVGTKPWRATTAEAALTGQPPGVLAYQAAAEAALAGAVGRTHNTFKIELARRTLVRALSLAAATRST